MIRPLQSNRLLAACVVLAALFVIANAVHAAEAPEDWKKVLEAAKREGKVVVGGPPTSVLRQKFKETFEKRFGIELEILSAPGPQNASRAISEFKAGVKYFDVLHGGSGTLEPLMRENMLAPFMDFVILAEVRDPRQWWGGHMWEDNIKTYRFIYSYSADFSTPPFYNTDLVKQDEVKSYDDFLLPKWKGKIGFFEPRIPSAGQGLWGFLMKIKGKEFLQKLANHELFISRDGKQLADSMSKGTLAFNLGQSQRFIEPYIKAGIPIKPLNNIKEGLSGSNGFGTVAIMKNAAQVNAAKVYINWLLGKEGQDLYSQALTQGTRRLDVDTKWLAKFDSAAAKDVMTPEEFEKVRFYGEDIIKNWREPGGEFARVILK